MKAIKLILALLITALLVACGGNFAGPNRAANSNAANSPPANFPSPEISNVNANITDAVNSNIQTNVIAKRPVKPKPEETPIDAPDDSELTSEKNAQGDVVDIRIFKNHDMVAKVERTQNAAKKETSIKVYLKNGKVYEIPANKIKDVLRESPEEIIKAVGEDVITATSQPANRTQTDPKAGASAANSAPANSAATPEKH